MGLLAAKLFLAPALVVGASLAARRWGSRIGGLVGALPVVAGPILLVFALQHGDRFAAHAAKDTLVGLISLTAFALTYARVSARTAWPVSLVAGWLAFLAMTALFSAVAIPLALALPLTLLAFRAAAALLPTTATFHPQRDYPAWDLPLRALVTACLVVALTTASGGLGPGLSGLLAPFPIVTGVLAAFTHAHRGHTEAVALLRGMLVGFVAFAAFCFAVAVAVALPGAGIAGAFVLATAIAVLIQAGVIGWRLRTSIGPQNAAEPANTSTGSG
jgi:hypothetical protein